MFSGGIDNNKGISISGSVTCVFVVIMLMGIILIAGWWFAVLGSSECLGTQGTRPSFTSRLRVPFKFTRT